MTLHRISRIVATAIIGIATLSAFWAGRTPAADVAALVKAYLSLGQPPGWDGIEGLPAIRWAPLPPTSLTNCLPDGGCYTRQGNATIGGRTMTVIATGARTMALHLYIRNAAAPVGGEPVLAALREAGLTADLARCPVAGGAGTTSWYRLKGAGISNGVFSIQSVRAPRPSEGFTLSAGDELPALQPNQMSMYTEQCAPGAARTAEARVAPHERLAEVVVALLVPASSPALAWSALPGLATGIEWNSAGPRTFSTGTTQSGSANYGGRHFSVQASGTATQVKVITLEETGGRHPRGEHMLGVVYTKGIAVRLVRCGPIYTESTNNWYSMNSPRTRPAMIRQSLSWEGSNVNSVADSYEIRLDGTLPARDPRDRDPGVNGCQ